MVKVHYVRESDKEFWYRLDRHLPESEFLRKVRDKRGYVLEDEQGPVGILRYNLFWDNTPFLNLLFVVPDCQCQGYGTTLMAFWEKEMKEMGFEEVLLSTQVDEKAQHFYRKLGYRDCGCLNLEGQAMEMFMRKTL